MPAAAPAESTLPLPRPFPDGSLRFCHAFVGATWTLRYRWRRFLPLPDPRSSSAGSPYLGLCQPVSSREPQEFAGGPGPESAFLGYRLRSRALANLAMTARIPEIRRPPAKMAAP